MFANLDTLQNFWTYWMDSLRTGPRVRLPLIGYLHRGVIDFLTPYWLLAGMLVIAAMAVYLTRRRHRS